METMNTTLANKLTKHFPEVDVEHAHRQYFNINTPAGFRNFSVFATDGKFETAYKVDSSGDFIATYSSQRATIAAIADELGVAE